MRDNGFESEQKCQQNTVLTDCFEFQLENNQNDNGKISTVTLLLWYRA